MKIASGALLFALLGSMAQAHPGLNPDQKGQPCPFLENQAKEQAYERAGQGYKQAPMRNLAERTGDGGVPEGGFAAVEADLLELMFNSNPDWPADFLDRGTPSYAGLFIRLAWHCSGSYRESDGRGGCDGGRIRFDPEINWEDNANLDKALMLLQGIKDKYGSSLSWGDLIVLSGNAAIKSGEGPILGFCGGRIDDADGSDSLKLGPSAEQEEIGPCLSLDLQGDCLSVEGTALGPTTVGLIYVNPGGPVTAPNDPVASGEDIRRAFARMGFDDQVSTALIGGGHAYGKAHGACPNPPCGDGKGENTFTAGFEGAWTTIPTKWSNQYFTNLFDFNWTLTASPAGAMQWAPVADDDQTTTPDIFMLTSDIALRDDPAYLPYAEMYADDIELLNTDFAAAWYRLTSADMGPASRCIGDMVPEPQLFQYTLPASPETLPDYIPVRTAIEEHFGDGEGSVEHAVEFITAAYACASTFRATDYRGGINGARCRFPPEVNELDELLVEKFGHLESVKSTNNFDDVPMADMIVLAGIVALDKVANIEIPFCGGYVDAENADGSEALLPRIYPDPYVTITDDWLVKGLSIEQGVALAPAKAGGIPGTRWFADLLAGNSTGFDEYALALLDGNVTQAYVETFAVDETAFNEAYASGWIYMMTANRFLNNRENACAGVSVPTAPVAAPTPDSGVFAATASFLSAILGLAAAAFAAL